MGGPWDAQLDKDNGGVQMLIYLLAVFFRADSYSTPRKSCRVVQSSSLDWFLFVSAGNCPNQAGCSTDWWRKLSPSQFLGVYSHSLLFLFNSLHVIHKNKKLVLFCGESHIFIGYRLEWALGGLLCPVVVVFYVWQCPVLSKAKLCKVYMWVSGRVQTLIVWAGANQLNAGQACTIFGDTKVQVGPT